MSARLPDLAQVQIVGRWVTWVGDARDYESEEAFNAAVAAVPDQVRMLQERLLQEEADV